MGWPLLFQILSLEKRQLPSVVLMESICLGSAMLFPLRIESVTQKQVFGFVLFFNIGEVF